MAFLILALMGQRPGEETSQKGLALKGPKEAHCQDASAQPENALVAQLLLRPDGEVGPVAGLLEREEPGHQVTEDEHQEVAEDAGVVSVEMRLNELRRAGREPAQAGERDDGREGGG